MGKSNWPDISMQLDVTVLAIKHDENGGLAPLTKEEQEAIIHALIKKFNGTQDPATGTVIILLLDKVNSFGPSVQLLIHDWE
jgi:hypothetical protein